MESAESWQTSNERTHLRWRLICAALKDYDGGNGCTSSTVTSTQGAMWEEDTDFVGRVPIGAGLIPGTTTPAITTAVGDPTGVAEHTLTEAEGGVGVHTHGFGKYLSGAVGLSYPGSNTVPAYTGAVVQGIGGHSTASDTTANCYTLPSGSTGGRRADAYAVPSDPACTSGLRDQAHGTSILHSSISLCPNDCRNGFDGGFIKNSAALNVCATDPRFLSWANEAEQRMATKGRWYRHRAGGAILRGRDGLLYLPREVVSLERSR